ncbi:MAG: hypothetical protein QXG39_10050 [Candidatus Aenigmatarchaeota archaeon]
MSWGEAAWGVSDEVGELFSDLMSEIGEYLHPGIEHLQDPEKFLDLWEFFLEHDMDEQADEALEYALYYISKWEEITGYQFDWNTERWRDPETGRFVRDPYHDPDWVNDPDVWGEFAY